MKTLDARSRDLREIAEVVHLLSRNRSGEVTLTPGATVTTVIDPTVTPDSFIQFAPLTATAGTEVGMHVLAADQLLGSFTITHANSAVTDRTFRWIAAGD
jgi:alkanesulfonate monooxygenase SsuD/methylene tetrahydromethanopterin reductase-like flavin-dependent oxidoreductase (luciferase family)